MHPHIICVFEPEKPQSIFSSKHFIHLVSGITLVMHIYSSSTAWVELAQNFTQHSPSVDRMLLCMYWRNICIQFVNKKYTDQCVGIQKKGQASAKHPSPCLSHCLSNSPARALSLPLVHGNCMKLTHFAKKKQLIFLLCSSFCPLPHIWFWSRLNSGKFCG